MTKRSLNRSIAVFCAFVFGFGISVTGFAQSNIVFNGGFEQRDVGWTVEGPLSIHEVNGSPAEGNIDVIVHGSLSQDLNTVPGRDYVISYAWAHRYTGPGVVTWGGNILGPFTTYADAGYLWNYAYCYARAISNVTQLRFQALAMIDDVRVGWLQEPIQIMTQPASRTGLEGGTVSFSVTASAAPPVRYLWRFKGTAIPGATNRSFTITPLAKQHEGDYSVIISNVSGSVTSQNAALQVAIPPTAPEIVTQPIGDVCPAAYGCSLRVFAVGAQPLRYQWSKDGTEVSGATNRSLTFGAIQTGDAGTYRVLVSNDRGTVLSLPATLVVTNTSGGARVMVDGATNNAPIYDVDGTTRLGGPNFLAQIYAGPGPEILRPVGPAIAFSSGTFAGYLVRESRQIPDVAPGQIAYVQVRAWEAARGASYEEARAAGGKFGFSAVFNTPTTIFGDVRMQSFSLRAGEPFFVTGRLSVGEPLPGGNRQFLLTGDPGFRYLIEKRLPPHDWVPLLTVTNATGSVVFTDPEQQNRPMQFYRARILD